MITILLTAGIAASVDVIEDANALKSKGTKTQKYGSATKNLVCGAQLCSEIEEIPEPKKEVEPVPPPKTEPKAEPAPTPAPKAAPVTPTPTPIPTPTPTPEPTPTPIPTPEPTPTPIPTPPIIPVRPFGSLDVSSEKITIEFYPMMHLNQFSL
ncbi:hypothetical protein LCGC14_2687990 [marine sediment metagenome]|uniref:Uncharacterized protein n=1 Tax=marine sediment metagenome TaxID=412755 RepID=A0A0F9CB49_9ZZZZ